MEQQILPSGAIVGKRFTVESLAGQGDLGVVYRARDTGTGQVLALRVIPRSQIPEDATVEVLRERIKSASTLVHRNIRSTYGMGLEPDGTIFISMEWIDGRNLAGMLEKRAEAGKRFSFKGAYNIMGHICNGLLHAQGQMCHGALSPRAVMVSEAGRVKVSDWGLSLVRAGLAGYPGRQKQEAVFWAPEVLRDAAQASHLSDIYSLGTLFYQLITGVAPTRPIRAPSLLGFSKDVDAVIARCMAANPAQRYTDAAAVKQALAELVKSHEADVVASEVDDALSIDIEVDLGGASPTPPETPPAPSRPVQATAEISGRFSRPSSTGKAAVGAPGSPRPVGKGPLAAAIAKQPTGKTSVAQGTASQEAARSSAPGTGAVPAPPAAKAAPIEHRASVIDMGEVLGSLTKAEAARWMVQIKKFDHGPFSDRELVQMILRGEVEGSHLLLNMDTGVRKKVKAWGEFDEYLERYRIKKKEEEERLALQKTERAEKRSTFFKVMMALAVLGVLALGGGAYFIGRKIVQRKYYVPEDVVAAFDSGEIKFRTGGNLAEKARRGGGGKRRGGQGGGEFVPGMSYEEAMNMAVDLGDAKSGGGEKQLTPEVIGSIMDRNVRRFLPCMAGQAEKRVDVNLVIGGDGSVVGVSVKQGDGKLKGCVSSIVRGIRFPPTSASRTAASWYFEIY